MSDTYAEAMADVTDDLRPHEDVASALMRRLDGIRRLYDIEVAYEANDNTDP